MKDIEITESGSTLVRLSNGDAYWVTPGAFEQAAEDGRRLMKAAEAVEQHAVEEREKGISRLFEHLRDHRVPLDRSTAIRLYDSGMRAPDRAPRLDPPGMNNWAGTPGRCATCDGGGCPDCTDGVS